MKNIIILLLLFISNMLTMESEDYSPLYLYRSVDELDKNISMLTNNHPSFRHEECSQDHPIKYITIGSNRSQSMKVIITCNVHAHELITAQICVDLVNFLAQDSLFLSRVSLTVLYIANRNRQAVFSGDFCLRTNQNGVDPNRNFPIDFVQTSGETYGGEMPLSEGFSRCLDELAKMIQPNVYLDIHSGQFSYIYQQRYTDTDRDASEPILQQIKQKYCKNCRVVNVEDLKIGGQAFEYMKYVRGVKYSCLFEIYGGYKAGLPEKQLCFTIFNPLTQRQLTFYKQRARSAIISYLQMVLEQRESTKMKQK